MSHFAFRLAFHDCLPYEGQEGVNINGCDGCLDLDNRLNDHNVLQPTVAMLVTYLGFLNSVFMYCVNRSHSIFLIRKKFTLRLIGLRQILGENLNQSWTQPLGTWDFQELTFGTLLAWWLLTTFKTKLRVGAMIQSK